MGVGGGGGGGWGGGRGSECESAWRSGKAFARVVSGRTQVRLSDSVKKKCGLQTQCCDFTLHSKITESMKVYKYVTVVIKYRVKSNQ